MLSKSSRRRTLLSGFCAGDVGFSSLQSFRARCTLGRGETKAELLLLRSRLMLRLHSHSHPVSNAPTLTKYGAKIFDVYMLCVHAH